VKSLQHIQDEGTFPVSSQPLSHRTNHGISRTSLTPKQPDIDSKEDKNTVGKCPVPDSAIEELKARVRSWTQDGNPGFRLLEEKGVRLCIFDGFLLYSESLKEVQPLMDIKVFLRVSYAKAKARREARSGYVTLEGFWQDPPGYVDKIVWPNYVEDHKFLFESEDVEGKLRDEVVREWGIHYLQEGLDVDMKTMLEWAVDILMERLPELSRRS